MVLNKNNIDENLTLKSSSDKIQQYILIDKGLGPFQSNIRPRNKSIRYVDSQQFVKLYADNN